MTWIWQYTAAANDAVNLAPATGAWSVYYIKEALKQAGWTVPASSDGTTYNAAGDQITTGNAGAGGMANVSAWFRIQSPAGAGGREFTFQRTNNTQWRVKFSHSAGFTATPTGAGPPAVGATVTPSATDEQIILGSGTDGVPGYATWFAGDGTYKQHIGTDNASPYAFWTVRCPNGGGVTQHFIYAPLLTSSYPAEDAAPYVVGLKTTAAASGLIGSQLSLYNAAITTVGIGYGYVAKGLPGEKWLAFPAMTYWASGVECPSGAAGLLGVNPYDSDANPMPIAVGRVSGDNSYPAFGWKGWIPTAMMAWKTYSVVDGGYDDVGADRYTYFDDLAYRWPQAVVPSV